MIDRMAEELFISVIHVQNHQPYVSLLIVEEIVTGRTVKVVGF